MKHIKKIILASIPAFSLFLTSCINGDIFKEDAPILIYLNDVVYRGTDAGDFSTTELPRFSYFIDTEEPLSVEWCYMEGEHNLGYEEPNIEGSYSYVVSTEAYGKYKATTRKVDYRLIDNRAVPTISIYLSVDGDAAQEVTGDFAGTIEQGLNYEFTAIVDPDTLNYSRSFASTTITLDVQPTEPGDYTVTYSVTGNDQYKNTSKTVSFTIESNQDKPTSGTTEINICAINDFHGQIEAQSGKAGLVKYFSYLKQQKDNNPDTLLLDQGDTWQGSIYSNDNRGKLLTDVTNYCHFDARTIGNHDFDWGSNILKENAERTYDGYKTPTLGANVYKFDFSRGENGELVDEFRSDLGIVKYTTKTLSNQVKVGIVGVIGKDQITSICTNNSRDIVFKEHIQTIKDVATTLRNDLSCDVVICSIHAEQEDVMGNGLEGYVDLVLCSHSHELEYGEEGNLHYLQFASNAQYVGRVTLTYDYLQKDVIDTSYLAVAASDISVTSDSTISSLVDTYKSQCSTDPDQVLAKNASGSFYSGGNSGTLPNIMANAIYDAAVAAGQNIDLAMLNNARTSLYRNTPGDIKYSDIYQAFPFDNIIYITDVKGSELIKELVNYRNFFYRSDSFTQTSFDSNATYRIAIIDYLFMHTGVRSDYSRPFDYFSYTKGAYITTLDLNYRLILRQWLINEGYASGAKTLVASDFATSDTNTHFIPFTN